MALVALRFEADGALAERWGDAFLESGALSVDVTDPAAGTPAEQPLYGASERTPAPPWPRCRMTVLLRAASEVEGIWAAAAGIVQEPVPPYSIEPVADADWVRQTQAQFRPIRVADRLWIVPSWCEPVDPAAINIRLDPGLAFGTGEHPTTQLCLRWLAEHLRPGESVLDYGCGSGVLAIAAAKLGAGTVIGVDVDPAAIATSRANAEANGVQARFVLPEDSSSVQADVVVANILANPLELLAPLLAQRVADRGRIVLSGILEPQAAAVAAAYSRWFNMDSWAREGDWVALVGARSAP